MISTMIAKIPLITVSTINVIAAPALGLLISIFHMPIATRVITIVRVLPGYILINVLGVVLLVVTLAFCAIFRIDRRRRRRTISAIVGFWLIATTAVSIRSFLLIFRPLQDMFIFGILHDIVRSDFLVSCLVSLQFEGFSETVCVKCFDLIFENIGFEKLALQNSEYQLIKLMRFFYFFLPALCVCLSEWFNECEWDAILRHRSYTCAQADTLLPHARHNGRGAENVNACEHFLLFGRTLSMTPLKPVPFRCDVSYWGNWAVEISAGWIFGFLFLNGNSVINYFSSFEISF